MQSTNDVESDKRSSRNDDFNTCEEEQLGERESLRAASLDKLVDYCAEEFGKLLVSSASFCNTFMFM